MRRSVTDAHTQISITDTSGSLASNVAALRFSFTSFENGGTAFREFDGFGVAAIPESGTVALWLGLGALAAMLGRMRVGRPKSGATA
jgi:hypothetical protein